MTNQMNVNDRRQSNPIIVTGRVVSDSQTRATVRKFI